MFFWVILPSEQVLHTKAEVGSNRKRSTNTQMKTEWDTWKWEERRTERSSKEVRQCWRELLASVSVRRKQRQIVERWRGEGGGTVWWLRRRRRRISLSLYFPVCVSLSLCKQSRPVEGSWVSSIVECLVWLLKQKGGWETCVCVCVCVRLEVRGGKMREGEAEELRSCPGILISGVGTFKMCRTQSLSELWTKLKQPL